MKFIIDTNIIIKYMEGDIEVISSVDFMLSLGYELSISVITEIELLSTDSVDQKNKILFFIKIFRVISFDSDIARLASDVRVKVKMKLPDAVILATAICHRAELITKDAELDRKYKLYKNSYFKKDSEDISL